MNFSEAHKIFQRRGITRHNQGDFPGAIADFTEALRINPAFAQAYHNRASARFAQGDLAGAIDDLGEALRIDPGFVEVYRNRGWVFLTQGNFPAAMADFDRAIQMDPGFAQTYNDRGAAHYDAGDLVSAIADFTEALRINPASAQAYSNRGCARCARGDLGGSIEDINLALRLNPRYADAFTNRGWTRLDQGDFAGAVADFDEVIRLDPASTEAPVIRTFASQLAQERGAALGSDFDTLPQRATASWLKHPTSGPEKEENTREIINGVTWRETIFFRKNTFDIHFATSPMTLGELFQQDFTGYRKYAKGDLPLFAFYKKNSSLIHPSTGKHVMDFTKNNVHILVSEFDSWRGKSPKNRVFQKAQIGPFAQGDREDPAASEDDRLHAYALEIWEKLKQDPRILFSYLTPSGLGIRFGLFFRQPIRSSNEYRAYFMHYTWQLLQEYDSARLLKTDPSIFRGHNYWFYPTSTYVYLNEACQSL